MDRNVVVIGGGNSIRKELPQLWNEIKDIDILAINHAYKAMPYTPKYLCSIDATFWEAVIKAGVFAHMLKKGVQVIAEQVIAEQVEGVLEHKQVSEASLKLYKKTKVQDRSEGLYVGSRNFSGMMALSFLCQHTDYSNIYLLGYDFGAQDGRVHFYNKEGRVGAYEDGEARTHDAVNEFEYFNQFGKRIVIVGQSNIKAFPTMTYAEFVNKI